MHPWKRLCAMGVLGALLTVTLTGCVSLRYKTTLPASQHDVSRWNGVSFAIANVDTSGLVRTADTSEHLPGLEANKLRQELQKRYPNLFTSDRRAIPLHITVSGRTKDNMPLSPMLTGFTLGVIPFPDNNAVQATVRVDVQSTGSPLISPYQAGFLNERVMYISIVGPLGLLPVIGPSDAPRGAAFFMIPLTSGMFSTESRSVGLASVSLGEAVMLSLDAMDTLAVRKVHESRKKMFREVDIGGQHYFVTLELVRAVDGSSSDVVNALVFDSMPAFDKAPVETVRVAVRDGARWKISRGFLHLPAQEDWQVSALLDNGIPAIPLVQRADPSIEDLLEMPATINRMQWTLDRLLSLKNRRWPQEVAAMEPDLAATRMTLLEKAILEGSASIERANDAAQNAAAQGKEAGASREWAIQHRQRVEVLKALLGTLRSGRS